jgi:16S rRNA (uracil1498-N3)-methyltransferase
MRRFYLESTPENNTARIRGDEARHIEKVLRLGPGDSLELFDADGSVYRAEIESLHRGEVIARICARIAGVSDSDVHITLCQAVVKSQKMDFIVEKCTELGVTEIQPFFAHRSVPRWDEDKAAQRVQHWRRIALAAVKQSGARRPPAIEPVLSFKEVLAKPYSDSMRVMLWECERDISLRSLLANCSRRIVLIVGPEGGFTNEEASLASSHEFQFAGLGDRILRVETAAIVGVAVAAYEFGALGG